MTSGCIGQVYFCFLSCSCSCSPCGRLRSIAPTCARATSVTSATALATRAKISFRISSGCRAGASPASWRKRQPERLPYKQNADVRVLRAKRRGVSKKAPLQDQLSERVRVGWPRVERRRCLRVGQKRNEHEFFNAKIDVEKLGVIARPTFRLGENNCA